MGKDAGVDTEKICLMTYLRDLSDNITAHTKPLYIGAHCDESSRRLQLQVPRNFSKGFVLLRVFHHAVQVLVSDVVLGIHQLEEALQQACPELVEGLFQVDVGAPVIAS